MVVVVILAFVAAVAAVSMRSTRGDKAPAYARSLLAMAHEARATALSTGLATRLWLIPATSSAHARVVLETTDPASLQFLNTSAPPGGLPTPNDVDLAGLLAATDNTGQGPPGPTLTTQKFVCFFPSGKVNTVVTTGNKCDTTSPSTGATMYVRSFDNQKKYKIMIWGLTGLPRLADTY